MEDRVFMPNLLAICHSVGDSAIIIEIAKKLAEESIKTTILFVGSAARKRIECEKKLPVDFIDVLDLDESLPDVKPIAHSYLKLEETEMRELINKLDVKKFDAVLVGTPSYVKKNEQCDIPEQLLIEISKVIYSVVVSDYTFYDPEHHLATRKWFNRAKKFLVPFEKAIAAFGLKSEKKTNELQTIVVGHPSIDAVKVLYQNWFSQSQSDESCEQKRNGIREKSNVQFKDKFLFVAGGKAGDEAMIRALANICEQFLEIQIRIGMHPAATKEYLFDIQKIIDENKRQDQIAFLPELTNTYEAVFAADGVMTVSSTVGTIAADCDKFVSFYQEGVPEESLIIPYIVDGKKAFLHTKKDQLYSFFQLVKESSKPMTEKNVALEGTAVEKIVNELRAPLIFR